MIQATKTRIATAPWLRAWGMIFTTSWGGNQFSSLLLMYEQRLHYSPLATNFFLGVYVLGLIPALLVAGSVSTRYGRKPIAIAAMSASLLGSTLLALGPLGAAWIVVGRLLCGIAVGIAMSVATTWVGELSGQPYDSTNDPRQEHAVLHSGSPSAREWVRSTQEFLRNGGQPQRSSRILHISLCLWL